ncbi:hypothetical protein AB1Y20_023340 [Prymnesium parvum]
MNTCELVTGQARNESARGVTLQVEYTGDASFSTLVSFDVLSPSRLTISAADSTLNRIEDAAGHLLSSCTNGGATRYPYQSTRLKATAVLMLAQGLTTIEITNLVLFKVDALGVATVGDGSDWNLLLGRAAGTATVFLGTQNASSPQDAPSLRITVSDTPVRVQSMLSRVVTDVTWASSPASAYSYGTVVTVSVLVRQRLAAEGDSGRLFSRVVWSDGASEDVGVATASGLDEMRVVSGTPNVVVHEPQSNSDGVWKLGVAFAASTECVTSVQVNWTVCGSAMASASVPMYIDVPEVTNATIYSLISRLTAVDDDARLSPIGVPTSASLTLIVGFSDGSSKDMTADSRVSYSVDDDACALLDNARHVVAATARTAGCSEIVVLATVAVGSSRVTARLAIPLVYVDRITLEFVGYPSYNSHIKLTSLYEVECQSGVYQHAAPLVTARLTDGSSASVTSASRLASSNETVLTVSDFTRLVARVPGSSIVSARFGDKMTASSTLEVHPEAAAVNAVVWGIAEVTSGADQTLLQYFNHSTMTRVSVTFASMSGQLGSLSYHDLGADAFAGWVDISTMLSFSSSRPYAVSVDDVGTLTLKENSESTIEMEVRMACSPSTKMQTTVKANLLPLEQDVDAGAASGFQFQQDLDSNLLPIELRIRGISSVANLAITAFSVKVYGYDTRILTSKTAQGASFVSSGIFSGTESELDGVHDGAEGGLARVLGADAASTVSGGLVGLNVGTLTLAVVGSGVTLVDVEIENLEIFNTHTSTKFAELQYVGALAAVGYASVGIGRRSLAAEGVERPPPELGGYSGIRRRRQRRGLESSCDPCTALVWGDFNGDCNFLPSDISALQRMVLRRVPFASGEGTDPLETLDWTVAPVTSCASFIQLQANPTRDVMDFGVGDPRYLAPKVDSTDNEHLLAASVKKYRLLADMDASCTFSSFTGSTNQELLVVARVVGGDGQNTGTVGADPARTDVLAELRISPSANFFNVSVGALVHSRAPSSGYPASTYSGMGSDQIGILTRLAHRSDGDYELRLQPQDESNSVEFRYEIALMVETKASADVASTALRSKPWLGSSVLPYTNSGFTFRPVWGGGAQLGGGGSSFLAGRAVLTCASARHHMLRYSL